MKTNSFRARFCILALRKDAHMQRRAQRDYELRNRDSAFLRERTGFSCILRNSLFVVCYLLDRNNKPTKPNVPLNLLFFRNNRFNYKPWKILIITHRSSDADDDDDGRDSDQVFSRRSGCYCITQEKQMRYFQDLRTQTQNRDGISRRGMKRSC